MTATERSTPLPSAAGAVLAGLLGLAVATFACIQFGAETAAVVPVAAVGALALAGAGRTVGRPSTGKVAVGNALVTVAGLLFVTAAIVPLVRGRPLAVPTALVATGGLYLLALAVTGSGTQTVVSLSRAAFRASLIAGVGTLLLAAGAFVPAAAIPAVAPAVAGALGAITGLAIAMQGLVVVELAIIVFLARSCFLALVRLRLVDRDQWTVAGHTVDQALGRLGQLVVLLLPLLLGAFVLSSFAIAPAVAAGLLGLFALLTMGNVVAAPLLVVLLSFRALLAVLGFIRKLRLQWLARRLATLVPPVVVTVGFVLLAPMFLAGINLPAPVGTVVSKLGAGLSAILGLWLLLTGFLVFLGIIRFFAGVGIFSGRRGVAGAAAGLLFLTVLVAGVAAPRPLFLLAGTAGALLVWDITEHALGIGEQLRHRLATPNEFFHTGASTLAAAGAVGVGYGTISLAGKAPIGPVLSGAILLLAAVSLAVALSR